MFSRIGLSTLASCLLLLSAFPRSGWAHNSLADCSELLESSAAWDHGIADRKWGPLWIAEPMIQAVKEKYSISSDELRTAVSWIRETSPELQSAFPQAAQYAVVDVPNHRKFRIQFQSRGPGQGSRIFGLASLEELTRPPRSNWYTDADLQYQLEFQNLGWNQRRLESQAKWLGEDIDQDPEEAGLIVHFDSSQGSQRHDLQIAFLRQEGTYVAQLFDAPQLFVLENHVRLKLSGKHHITHRDLREIFSRWDGRAAREQRAWNLEREQLPRYWIIGETKSGRLAKVVFAWDPMKRLPIIVSAYKTSRAWLLTYQSATKIPLASGY